MLSVTNTFQLMAMLGVSVGNRQKENDKYKIACQLIEKGASYKATNNRGANPLQVCQSERLKKAVVEVLERRLSDQYIYPIIIVTGKLEE